MTPTECKLLQTGMMVFLIVAIVLVIKYIPRGDEKENKFKDDMDH